MFIWATQYGMMNVWLFTKKEGWICFQCLWLDQSPLYSKNIGPTKRVLEENDLTMFSPCTSCRLGTSVSMVIQQEWRGMWISDVKIHPLQPIYTKKILKVSLHESTCQKSFFLGMVVAYDQDEFTCHIWLLQGMDAWYVLWIIGS